MCVSDGYGGDDSYGLGRSLSKGKKARDSNSGEEKESKELADAVVAARAERWGAPLEAARTRFAAEAAEMAELRSRVA